jgi:hypothetical protein
MKPAPPAPTPRTRFGNGVGLGEGHAGCSKAHSYSHFRERRMQSSAAGVSLGSSSPGAISERPLQSQIGNDINEGLSEGHVMAHEARFRNSALRGLCGLGLPGVVVETTRGSRSGPSRVSEAHACICWRGGNEDGAG